MTNITNFDLFWLILTNFELFWLISTYYRQILLILTYFWQILLISSYFLTNITNFVLFLSRTILSLNTWLVSVGCNLTLLQFVLTCLRFYLISIGCCCFTAAFLTAWNISSWHFSYNALSLKPCLTTSNECATWTGFAICNYYIQSLRIFNWPSQHAPLSQWDCFKYSNIEHTLFVSNMTNVD